MAKQVYSTPSDVNADEGAVSVEGPDGVSVQLTPEAAEETSARLTDKANAARGQQHGSRPISEDEADPAQMDGDD